MATNATYLSAGSDWDNRVAGDGLCVFFYDGQADFHPGGIGSSLGYSNYRGPIGYKASTLGHSELSGTMFGPASATDINGIQHAYVGVGFDVKGEYSTTSDGKLGTELSGSSTTSFADCVSSNLVHAVTSTSPNTIGVRLGESTFYRLHSVTSNLNTYPLSGDPYTESYGVGERYVDSPAVNLHQSVATRSDVVFQTARVTLQNQGKRVLVEIKDNTTGIY